MHRALIAIGVVAAATAIYMVTSRPTFKVIQNDKAGKKLTFNWGGKVYTLPYSELNKIGISARSGYSVQFVIPDQGQAYAKIMKAGSIRENVMI
jgi:hypothetical protein